MEKWLPLNSSIATLISLALGMKLYMGASAVASESSLSDSSPSSVCKGYDKKM
jgi:hypothetical protein